MIGVDYWDDNSPLCCCEYYDKNNERAHILACCCDCFELDECCDSILCCKLISLPQMHSALSKMQDRLRIPWSGGAKQISFDAISAIFLLPTFLMLATLHPFMSFAITLFIIIFLRCIYAYQSSHQTHSRFFQMWTITSVFIIWFVFEFMGQPFLEITMGENIAFNILFNLAVFCIYVCRKGRGSGGYMLVMDEVIQDEELGEDNCRFCKNKHGVDTVYCSICGVCVEKQEYHNVWFNCCIGKHNRRSYVLFLILGVSALSFGSNLQFTTVCNSFNLYKTILMPNDCGEVYDQFDSTVCFVSGIYSLLLALFMLWYLLQQLWFISLGITGSEWRRQSDRSLIPNRPNSRGFFKNWLNFIFKK